MIPVKYVLFLSPNPIPVSGCCSAGLGFADQQSSEEEKLGNSKGSLLDQFQVRLWKLPLGPFVHFFVKSGFSKNSFPTPPCYLVGVVTLHHLPSGLITLAYLQQECYGSA